MITLANLITDVKAQIASEMPNSSRVVYDFNDEAIANLADQMISMLVASAEDEMDIQGLVVPDASYHSGTGHTIPVPADLFRLINVVDHKIVPFTEYIKFNQPESSELLTINLDGIKLAALSGNFIYTTADDVDLIYYSYYREHPALSAAQGTLLSDKLDSMLINQLVAHYYKNIGLENAS